MAPPVDQILAAGRRYIGQTEVVGNELCWPDLDAMGVPNPGAGTPYCGGYVLLAYLQGGVDLRNYCSNPLYAPTVAEELAPYRIPGPQPGAVFTKAKLSDVPEYGEAGAMYHVGLAATADLGDGTFGSYEGNSYGSIDPAIAQMMGVDPNVAASQAGAGQHDGEGDGVVARHQTWDGSDGKVYHFFAVPEVAAVLGQPVDYGAGPVGGGGFTPASAPGAPAAAAESLPLAAGMRGPLVEWLQTALNALFGTNLPPNGGVFDQWTTAALTQAQTFWQYPATGTADATFLSNTAKFAADNQIALPPLPPLPGATPAAAPMAAQAAPSKPEAFPLQPGMVGPNVEWLQNGLNALFGTGLPANGGVFDHWTGEALKRAQTHWQYPADGQAPRQFLEGMATFAAQNGVQLAPLPPAPAGAPVPPVAAPVQPAPAPRPQPPAPAAGAVGASPAVPGSPPAVRPAGATTTPTTPAGAVTPAVAPGGAAKGPGAAVDASWAELFARLDRIEQAIKSGAVADSVIAAIKQQFAKG